MVEIDGEQIGVGTQLAGELLNGLLIGYEFGGAGEIPCLQIVDNGVIDRILLE